MLPTMSSLYSAAYEAAKALDNDPATFSHTWWSATPEYYRLDLGNSYRISSVTLKSRSDVAGERLEGAEVFLLDAAGAIVYGPRRITGAATGVTHSFAIPPGVNARSVKINAAPGSTVEIAELDVMGFAASAPVVTSPPHAPTSICGTAVS